MDCPLDHIMHTEQKSAFKNHGIDFWFSALTPTCQLILVILKHFLPTPSRHTPIHSYPAKMHLILAVSYISTILNVIHRISAAPVGVSNIPTSQASTRASSIPPWINSTIPNNGTIPADPQIFCRRESQKPIYTAGDEDTGGHSILLWNFDPTNHNGNGTMFYLYESDHDFVPYKYIIIPPWQSAFVAVCPTFRGRVVRGDYSNLNGKKHLLGTWAEMNWHADGSAWGDISILQGNDGAAIIQSLDGSQDIRGFTLDLLFRAPINAWAQKPSGSWCLDKIIGADANNVAKNWETQFLDPRNVYLVDNIDPVIYSDNGRFQVTFYQGVI
ncbi:hypothetical protein F4779DRAFT_597255 [Xylariaceae sp. FL0662B]|nr:hypothetical protein F4779DRAFT_597255 [Xylariaceae sp. FL0662B]